MAQEDLINVFKYIVKKCDMLINNSNYEADAYTQDIVEDIAELCNHILDGDYGKLVEVKDVDLEKEILNHIGDEGSCKSGKWTWYECNEMIRYFFELGIKATQKEVNLEKEIKDYFNNQPIITRSKGVDYQLIPTGVDIAKHFYELGLKAVQKGE